MIYTFILDKVLFFYIQVKLILNNFKLYYNVV